MVQIVDKRGSLFGQIGRGFGQGLSEQLPKEIENYRLRSGLQNLANEADRGQLSPSQFLAKAAGTYGATPQMVQSFGELAKQQQLGQSLRTRSAEDDIPKPFPKLEETEKAPEYGLTKRAGQEALRKGSIPKTLQESDRRAAELYEKNPGRFKNDPQNAIDYARAEAIQEQEINKALQDQRLGQQNLQKSIQSGLQTQAGLLGAKVPGNIYSDIEQRAIKSVLPTDEGGEGLTEEEAKIKYAKELDEVSREYGTLRSLGGGYLPDQKPNEINRSLESLRSSFKKRDDLRNFADTLVSDVGLSPSKAYYKAFKNSDFPELNKTLNKLPDVKPKESVARGYPEIIESDYNADKILRHITPKLAKDMAREASPLAIAEELSSKGYDPDYFLRYVDENKEKLDLSKRQLDELGKKRSFYPTLNDIWFFKLSDQDKLVE